MEKAKRTSIHIENLDGITGIPTLIGEPKDLLVLASESIAYILEDHPEMWDAARTMNAITLEATQPKSNRVWETVFRIGKGILIGLAAFGLVSIGYLLKIKGVL